MDLMISADITCRQMFLWQLKGRTARGSCHPRLVRPCTLQGTPKPVPPNFRNTLLEVTLVSVTNVVMHLIFRQQNWQDSAYIRWQPWQSKIWRLSGTECHLGPTGSQRGNTLSQRVTRGFHMEAFKFPLDPEDSLGTTYRSPGTQRIPQGQYTCSLGPRG